jgi:cell division protein FtsB
VPQLQSTIKVQAVKIDALTAQSDRKSAEIRNLKKSVLEMQAGIFKLQSKDELVAQR